MKRRPMWAWQWSNVYAKSYARRTGVDVNQNGIYLRSSRYLTVATTWEKERQKERDGESRNNKLERISTRNRRDVASYL